MIWTKECSNEGCINITEYTNKRSWYNAKARGSQCKSCQSKQASEFFKGKKKPNYPKNRRSRIEPTEWQRNCPDCNSVIYYGSRGALNEGAKKKTLCGSCRTLKSGRGFNSWITEEHRKKMRATKAGFSSWKEYKEKYPKKKMYQNEVRRLTRLQPIHTLKNHDKLRGLNGVEGAYQVDHIISIDYGWDNEILPEQIADISNLQIIKWEDNITKGREILRTLTREAQEMGLGYTE